MHEKKHSYYMIIQQTNLIANLSARSNCDGNREEIRREAVSFACRQCAGALMAMCFIFAKFNSKLIGLLLP